MSDDFTKLDFQISEYDLQESHGVFSTIEGSLTNITVTQVYNFDQRKDVIYSPFTRPTTPSKITCETSQKKHDLVNSS